MDNTDEITDQIDPNSVIQALKNTPGATHYPPQPQIPYMHPNVPAAAQAIGNFAQGGLQQALGLPENAVSRALQNPDNQAAMGMVRIPISREALQMMREAGMGNEEIARRLGVHRNTIANRLAEFDMPRTQKIDWDAFEQLRNQGLDVKAIAQRMGQAPGNLQNAWYVRQSRARAPAAVPAAGPAPVRGAPSLPTVRAPMLDISAKEMADYLKTFQYQPPAAIPLKPTAANTNVNNYAEALARSQGYKTALEKSANDAVGELFAGKRPPEPTNPKAKEISDKLTESLKNKFSEGGPK